MANSGYSWLWLLGGGALGIVLLSSSKPAPGETHHDQPTNDPTKSNVKTPTEYIKKFYAAAKAAQTDTGVPASVVIAQSGIESGWGKHAPGFNFFGIKPGSKWTGETQILKTWECGKTGNPVKDGIENKNNHVIETYGPGKAPSARCAANMWTYRVNAKFRKYDSPEASFADYGKFLRANKRYADAFNYTNDPPMFGRKVVEAGYGNGANYAQILADTIKKVQDALPALGMSGACNCQHHATGSVQIYESDPNSEMDYRFMSDIMEMQNDASINW